MAIVAEEKLVALGGTKMPLVVVRDVLEAMRLQYRARAAPQPVNEVSLAGMCVRHGDRLSRVC